MTKRCLIPLFGLLVTTLLTGCGKTAALHSPGESAPGESESQRTLLLHFQAGTSMVICKEPFSKENPKTLCVPGLNCYSCPGALGSCPIGSLQAVMGSRKYQFSF